jgi:hypothetical protein
METKEFLEIKATWIKNYLSGLFDYGIFTSGLNNLNKTIHREQNLICEYEVSYGRF